MTIDKHLLPVEREKFPVEYAEQQLKVFWLPNEIKVEKDIQDVLVNMTAAEKHGVITTLKLFSLYETHAGSEYWGGRFREITKNQGAEFERMASVFSMFELAVHAPFYNKINQLLHIDNPEFYLSYLDNPTLKERIEFIGGVIDAKDDMISLITFSMVEGVILYSSFAFLKHFQSQGKNRMMNVVRGINFSVRDEHMHSEAGAVTFKYLHNKGLSSKSQKEYEEIARAVAENIVAHEDIIIDMIFEKGRIEGITPHQLKQFVRSRVNVCMKQLGFKSVYKVEYNPIADWFYKGINGYQFNDFFSGIGNQYHREWDESGFKWKAKDNE